nr:hypothetical protein [Tanacetum cinerariifolium]
MKHVVDEAIHKELGKSLVRATTIASSLEAEQDSGGGPRCQEAMKDTTAQTRVLELEKTKTTQSNEIASLKRKVKKLEKRSMSRTHKLKRLYKVGLTARLESSNNEKSLALEALKTSKPKVKGLVIQEPDESTTTTISSQQSQDKGKGIMIEEPVKPKKKD